MGRRHMQVVLDSGLELVGVVDADPAALDLPAEIPIPRERRFTDLDQALGLRPDCVIVATTATSHAGYTCRAAEAGARFILCEKPMATSLADCDRMIESCRIHGARLAINHQMRFMEQYTTARQITSGEAFGGLASVLVAAGNFGMAMNGTHYFEMFRYLSGEPPASVSAWFSPSSVPNPRGPQYEDRAGSARVTTASGKRLYLEVGDDQGHGVTVLYSGRHGQLLIDEMHGEARLSVREEQYRELPTTRYAMPAVRESWAIRPADALEPTRAVLQALLAGEDVPTGEDGRSAVATLIAAYISSENGGLVVEVVDGNLPEDRVFPWA